MTLTQIFVALREALQLLLNLVGIANVIQGNTNKAAQENVPFSIDTNTSITVAAVTDGTIGLAAIKTAIDTLTSNQATEFADIMAAIAAVQQTGAEVTLPIAFPAGWGQGTGDAVWDWLDPVQAHNIYTYLLQAGDFAHYKGGVYTYDRTPFALWPWKVVGGWDQTGENDPVPNTPPGFDPETIISSDATAFDWVTRVHPDWGAFDLGDGLPAISEPSSGNWYWVLDLPATDWFILKQSLGLTSTQVPTPPVWPGLAAVNLGTPVAISSGFTVPGPLHGVIVSITGLTGSKPFFDFDGSISYRNIGALTFQDDNGEEEFPQNLGFTAAVYCPKSMAEAAACLVRADASLSGTVTPWVIA